MPSTVFRRTPAVSDRSAEIAALLLLLRPGASSRERAAIDQCLQSRGFDWTAFVQRALAHRVAPLLARQVQVLAPENFPDDIEQALETYRAQSRRRSRALVHELHRITTALQRFDISVLTLKGPVFAAQAYDDIGVREYNDLDILIRQQDYRPTVRCLLGCGYHRDPSISHRKDLLAWHYYGQDILFKPRKDVAVEPHWRLLPSTFPAAPEFDDLWPQAAPCEVDGYRFTSLSLEDTLLALCLHHGKEQWCHLRQVCDVAYFVAGNPALDWHSLLARAGTCRCLRALLLGLSLSRELFVTRLPQMLVERIDADDRVRALSRVAIPRLLSATSHPPDIHKVSRFRARLQDNRPLEVSYLLRTVLMPSNRHFAIVYLSSWLEFLYYPVKWGHDYLMLPLWRCYKRVLASRAFNARRLGCH